MDQALWFLGSISSHVYVPAISAQVKIWTRYNLLSFIPVSGLKGLHGKILKLAGKLASYLKYKHIDFAKE